MTEEARTPEPQGKSELRHEFSELVSQFQDFAMAVSMSTLMHRQDAEDAAQASFLNAWLHLDQLEEQAAFPGWFAKIIRTECNRILRKRRDLLPLETAMAQQADKEPIDFIEQNRIREAVHTAIDALPEHERIVVSLFHIGGYRQSEIADYLEIPVSTVKKRIFDAKKRLAKLEIIASDPESVGKVLELSRLSTSKKFSQTVMNIADLIDGAASGDWARVKEIISKNPTLVSKSGDGGKFKGEDTPLRIASEFGHLEVVYALLKAGADPNQSNRQGVNPLISAAIAGHKDVVQFLIDHGAEVDIFSAATLGDLDVVQYAISANPEIVNERGPGGATLLNVTRDTDIAKLLLDHGADIDAEDIHGTLLDWISALGTHPDLASFLISRGARIKSSDIHALCRMGDAQAVKQALADDASLIDLPEPSTGMKPLHAAAHAGRVDIVSLLIDSGVPVDQFSIEEGDSPGKTALHNAAAMGHLPVLAQLIANGADPLLQDTVFNKTAKQWAEFFKRSESATYLSSVEHLRLQE